MKAMMVMMSVQRSYLQSNLIKTGFFFFSFRNVNLWLILLQVKRKVVELLLDDFAFRHAHRLCISNSILCSGLDLGKCWSIRERKHFPTFVPMHVLATWRVDK